MGSIFDTVKAELGDGPAYPRRADFTTIYGYAKGKTLGSFPDAKAANAAGAVTTEKTVDEPAFDAAMKAYRDHQSAISAEWDKRVRAEYPEVNDKVFDLAHSMAYDRGHSAGYGEVELYLSDYVEFAVKVLAAGEA